eukprot:TRINITY_DN33234_c0_g1_i1.p1 TRINITY_DN33234_c0_g1~~TRINITY_DN33234_c0_g1_i1.p1  ORF type:complete len:313 (+),score=52.94 TRINITY_DN33234_c0_g1_i1:107-1045(+)
MSAQPHVVSEVATKSSEKKSKQVQPVKEQYKATKLCKFFLAGTCTRGSACTFAHTKNQLRKLPDYSKTRMCQQFQVAGYCGKGATCNFAHSKEEMQQAALQRKVKAQEEHLNNAVKDAVAASSQLAPSLPQWVGPVLYQCPLQPIMMMQGVQFVPVTALSPSSFNEMPDGSSSDAITLSSNQLTVLNPDGASCTQLSCEFDKAHHVAAFSNASTDFEDQFPCLDASSTASTPRTDMLRQQTEGKAEDCGLGPVDELPAVTMNCAVDGVQVVVKNGFIHVVESDTDSDSEVSLVRAERRQRRTCTMPARLGSK